MNPPLAIDLFCGLGGWTEGLIAAGFRVVGFDIERHVYGESKYRAQLVLQDILTAHGSQFRAAALIVASPPCQNYSYLAMPWSKSSDPENSKAAKALRKKWETEGPDNRLFDACFRIQREAIEAAGRFIPLIVENVRGAVPWVGREAAKFGSFYLWGDVAQIGNRVIAGRDLADIRAGRGRLGIGVSPEAAVKVDGFRFDGSGRSFQTASVEATGQKRNPDGTAHLQGSWFRIADSSHGYRGANKGNGGGWFGPTDKRGDPRATPLNEDGTREGPGGTKIGGDWFSDPNSTCRKHGSRSNARKAASAMIAKIPKALSEYIGRVHFPHNSG